MKFRRLWIDGYKNLRNCAIDFDEPALLNAVIGSNGSGKSNLIEAILSILINVYFKKSPSFNFEFKYEAQNRLVTLRGDKGKISVEVDGEPKAIRYFAQRLRDRDAQVFYPELTFAYYSGECKRLHRLIGRYQKHFQKLTQAPDSDRLRPLFVISTQAQAQVILLALFAHQNGPFLKLLGLDQIADVRITLRSPGGYDPEQHEPKLWNTEGAVRRIVAAIEETSASQESRRTYKPEGEAPVTNGDFSETRHYYFHGAADQNQSIDKLAARLSLSRDNLYLALEHLRARGILISVDYQLHGRGSLAPFAFEQLSEGEKQLIAVIGAIRLTNQADNLVLLDEPDTHLNPHWSWEYPEMLSEAFSDEQKDRSTVLLATHDPIMISGLTREQVLLAHPFGSPSMITRPLRHPRGQGIANLLCSSEYFGLPSSLDKETQKLMDERLLLSLKETFSTADKRRLKALNSQLEIISPGVSERDPVYVEFLRQRDAQVRDQDALHSTE